MQIPRTLISNYTNGINALTKSAQAGLSRALASFEFTEDVAGDRERLIRIIMACLRPHLAISTRLAVEFYEQIREMSTGERLGASVSLDEVYDPLKTENAVRAFMTKAVDGKSSQIPNLLSQRIDYEMKLNVANTGYAMDSRDPKRVRWARVPSGSETCEFCLALAGQGFHYRTSGTAETHIHDGCDCRAVPNFGNDTVEGYSDVDYIQKFRDAVQERTDRWNANHGEDEQRTWEDTYEATYGNAARRARLKR